MLMKNGQVVPQPLTDALAVDTYALRVFMEMSETYQQLYVNQLRRHDYGDSMRIRLGKTIEDIRKYGEDNDIK